MIQPRDIFNIVRDAIFIADTDTGMIVDANRAAEALCGRSLQELRSMHHTQLHPSEYAESARQGFEKDTRVPGLTEGLILHKDGHRIPIEIASSHYTDTHGRQMLVGIFRDTTERKQAEAALRESERRYKEIFDNFSECIFVLDVTAEGRFKFAGLNPAEEKATGLSSSEVAGRFIEEVFPEDVAEPLIAHYRSCLEAGTIIQYDDELNLPSGTRFFRTNLLPLRDHDGRIQRIVGCCMDFTGLKRAQQEAFGMQKLESLGTLAGGIAHDFNNLLGAVLAQAELALTELAEGVHPQEELNRIREVATHGSEIVRQLMIYAGKETAILEWVDISEIVKSMIRFLNISVSKHAKLEADLGKDVRGVRASAAQIRQIVMNLVTNASEAIGDREGLIRVSTRCVTVGGAEAAAKGLPEGDYLQLVVADTGRGMPPEIQARVFDPFFTTKSGGGHGLGLSVVQRIVRDLRGAIRLESEPGAGTTFHILLPCAETTAEATKGPIFRTEKAARSSQEPTVLVVEDEDKLRQAASKMLRKRGFSVIEAMDGSAALEVIRAAKSPIDVLLLDITVPGSPSREVFEEVKRLRPEMKVIVTSAYTEEMAIASLAGRGDRFVRKPYRLADLEDLIRQSLS